MNSRSCTLFEKTKQYLCLLALPALLCSCAAEKDTPEEAVTETVSVTITADDNDNYDYILLRPWTGRELLNSIFYCGEYHPLPFSAEGDNADHSVSDGVIVFPDGSSASAIVDENGMVISMTFERGSAPSDFSVYGIGFDSVPDDIPRNMGIANSTYGDKEETITYNFFGGGIDALTFIYTENALSSVYISV